MQTEVPKDILRRLLLTGGARPGSHLDAEHLARLLETRDLPVQVRPEALGRILRLAVRESATPETEQP